MLRKIQVKETTYEKLEELAIQYGKDNDSVIVMALALLDRPSRKPPVKGNWPYLTHSKLISFARNGTEVIHDPTWNNVLRDMVEIAYGELQSFEKLKSLSHISVEKGSKRGSGYMYISSIDLSVHQASAVNVFKFMLRVAKEFGIQMEMKIRWTDKAVAEYKGRRGRITISKTGKEEFSFV